MRLPTSYKPALTPRSNPVLSRPHNLLPPSSIEQPKPRAAISSLHGVNGTSPMGIGRPTLSSARSTDDQGVPRAHRREPSPPPSPTRSAASQPPAPSVGGGGAGDSEVAR